MDSKERVSPLKRRVLVQSAEKMAAASENALAHKSEHDDKVVAFRKFQLNYLFVFILTAFADWLQGTHMYTLYEAYTADADGSLDNPWHPSNVGKAAISWLFITGFACSGLFGTVIGGFVDGFGRKFGVVLFCVLEIAINLMEAVPDMRVLLLGRLLGGVSTSLLFSAFESWMVTEHRARQFPESWLSSTFSYCQIGNGITAVVAGFVADIAVERYGNIGPFRVAVAVTVVVMLYVLTFWNENKGESQDGLWRLFPNAWAHILRSPRTMLVGLSHAFFEGAMYTFVFNWVPAMFKVYDSDPASIPLGRIFSTFMICTTLGGALYEFGSACGIKAKHSALVIYGGAALALALPAAASDQLIPVYCGFLLFELCVGASFACAGAQRSLTIPDSLQATTMNIFRLPLNALVIVGTSLDSVATTGQIFGICAQWLIFAFILQCVHNTISDTKAKSN